MRRYTLLLASTLLLAMGARFDGVFFVGLNLFEAMGSLVMDWERRFVSQEKGRDRAYDYGAAYWFDT